MMRIEQETKIPSPPKNDTIDFIFDSNWPSNNDKWNEKKSRTVQLLDETMVEFIHLHFCILEGLSKDYMIKNAWFFQVRLLLLHMKTFTYYKL